MTTPSFAKKEVAAAVQSLKKGKSAGVDNILAELVKVGGEDVITAIKTICNKIWQTGEWQTPWTQSLVITLPKKGNLQQCQDYRTISLISHPSKVMLKIILNRLKPQAERIIAEDQALFKAGRNTTEQTFNIRILYEKYLQHQQDLTDRRMANPVDLVLTHYTSQERQPAAVPELPNSQPHQSPKQSHAEDQTQQIEATNGEDHH